MNKKEKLLGVLRALDHPATFWAIGTVMACCGQYKMLDYLKQVDPSIVETTVYRPSSKPWLR